MWWLSVCVLCVVIVGEFKCDAIPGSHFGHGLQIGSANDASFTLLPANLSKLEQMLSDEDVKDREVAIISIAGTVNLGKSFVMNFFIRFLEAECDQRNVSDWERKDECMNGFDWGMIRTKGILVWPRIFKRTLPNGTKVAIILLDTQGLNSITSDSFNQDARIYAFSAMASSVQCYNVLRDLDSLDLGALDLFSGYGSLADKNKLVNSTKQFQNLNIIVRDKPMGDGDNFKYGHQNNSVKNLYLSILPTDTNAKEEQTKRIYKYYENIDLFYMPFPGEDVTQTSCYDGNLTKVKSLFIAHVNDLARSLFAPQNLVVKKVDGEAIKAKDFVSYLDTYSKMLNSDKLPDLGTYFQNILNIKYKSWQEEGLESYKKSMQNMVETCSPTNNVSYFDNDELLAIHNQSKNNAMKKFLVQKKLNSEGYIREYLTAIDKSIEGEFRENFEKKNTDNELCFYSKVKQYYTDMVEDISDEFEERILNKVKNAESFIEQGVFSGMRTSYIKNATLEFMARDKYANDPKYKKELAQNYMDKLKLKMVEILKTVETINDYRKSIGEYGNVAIRSNIAAISIFVVIAFIRIGYHLSHNI